MKQLEPKQVTIGENDFYIRPLPAFKAANLSGELAALLMPLAAGLFSLFPDGGTEAGEKGLFDIDVKDAAPVITKAFSSLSGDKVEELLRHLLLAGIASGDSLFEPFFGIILPDGFCTGKPLLSLGSEGDVLARFDFVTGLLHQL